MRSPARSQHLNPSRLVEGRWSLAGEQLGGVGLGNTVRKRELEVLGKELLDVRALHVVGLLELNHLEDLMETASVVIEALEYYLHSRGST